MTVGIQCIAQRYLLIIFLKAATQLVISLHVLLYLSIYLNIKILYIYIYKCKFFVAILSCFHPTQGDLSEDDVMMLDSGSNVFLWFGKRASEVERKLAVKSAQVRVL